MQRLDVRIISQILIVLSTLLYTPSLLAQSETDHENLVEVKLHSMHSKIALGKQKTKNLEASSLIALDFNIAPGWHIYWRNSGESAFPTHVTWTTPKGWKLSDLKWPVPKRFIERGDITTFGYQDRALLLAELFSTSEKQVESKDLEIVANVKWLVCKDICIPGKKEVRISLNTSNTENILSDSAHLIQEHLNKIPKDRIENLDIKAELSSSGVVPGKNTNVLFTINGLTPADTEIDVQLFAGPNEFLSLGSPEASWRDSTLHILAPLRASASTPLREFEIEGIVAFSKKHHLREDSLRWKLKVPASNNSSSNSKVLSRITELSFKALNYRLSHWQDHPELSKIDISPSKSNTAKPVESQPRSLAIILLFAFIGGMILNLMPCVLPIIAIKVMGFLEHSKTGSRGGALAFCLGILFSFVVLAAVVITLRSLGHQLGWGFQFQQPEFVLVIALIVFILGLGFFDMYAVALPFMQRYCSAVDSLEPSKLKHFFDGVIATILSTPCTAPFLGTALVFAFTQGPLVTLSIHLAIGLGLATPYFVLASNPKFLSILPKPGAWMHKLRQLLGFMLFATVVWLLFVLQKLSGQGAIWALVLMLNLVFTVWLYDWSKDWSNGKKLITHFLSACLLVSLTVYAFPKAVKKRSYSPTQTISKFGLEWKPFSKELLKTEIENNNAVFIDFTADWCLTCKANETLIINSSEVLNAIKENGITPMIADWTDGNKEITQALSEYGASGVPLYVVISPKTPHNPEVLSTIPSKAALVTALRNAVSK